MRTLRFRRLFLIPLLVILLSAFSAAEVRAAPGRTGIGVVFGEPTGLTFKHWTGSDKAIDGGLAYSFSDFLLIYADALWHFPSAAGKVSPSLRNEGFLPYLGIGGVLLLSTDSNRREAALFTDRGARLGLGLRLPFGVEWRPNRPPLGVFLELVPGVGVIPAVFGFFEAGVGLRYYF